MKAIAISVFLSFASSLAIGDSHVLTDLRLQRPPGHFALSERGGRCLLTYSIDDQRTELSLAPSPPCAFFRFERDADARIFQYPAFHADAVFMVGGGALSAEELAERAQNRWIPAGEVCVNQVQGIVLDGGTLYASRLIFRGIYCPNLGLDEKNYWMIAIEYAKIKGQSE